MRGYFGQNNHRQNNDRTATRAIAIPCMLTWITLLWFFSFANARKHGHTPTASQVHGVPPLLFLLSMCGQWCELNEKCIKSCTKLYAEQKVISLWWRRWVHVFTLFHLWLSKISFRSDGFQTHWKDIMITMLGPTMHIGYGFVVAAFAVANQTDINSKRVEKRISNSYHSKWFTLPIPIEFDLAQLIDQNKAISQGKKYTNIKCTKKQKRKWHRPSTQKEEGEGDEITPVLHTHRTMIIIWNKFHGREKSAQEESIYCNIHDGNWQRNKSDTMTTATAM